MKSIIVSLMLVFIAALSIAGVTPMVEKRSIMRDDKPHMNLKMDYPYIEGDQKFNRLIRENVLEPRNWYDPDTEETLDNLLKRTVKERDMCADYCNTITLSYEIRYQNPKFISIEFNGESNTHGAAHPASWSTTVNYSFEKGREVRLEELYDLNGLARLCNKKLKGADCDTRAVEPTPNDFMRWNVTGEGIDVSWDAYEIGPGACGPLKISLTHEELLKLKK